MANLPGTGRLNGGFGLRPATPSAGRPGAGRPAMLLLVSLLAALVLSSCASMTPRATEDRRQPVSSWFGVLPAGGTLYLAADVESSRGTLQRMLGDAGYKAKALESFLDRTSRLYASVQLAPDGSPDFSLIALGRYPRKPANFYLWTRREWQQRRSSLLYWRHRDQDLQVAVPRDGLILATNGEVEALAGRLQEAPPFLLPEEAVLDLESAGLAAYFPDLPPALRDTWGRRLPIREIWLSTREREEGYEMNGVFRLREARNPRLTENLFRLLVMVWLRGARVGNLSERLESVRVSATPDAVRVTGPVLTFEELTRSLQFLSGGASVE